MLPLMPFAGDALDALKSARDKPAGDGGGTESVVRGASAGKRVTVPADAAADAGGDKDDDADASTKQEGDTAPKVVRSRLTIIADSGMTSVCHH
jgi:hypothetical protein